MRGFRYTFVLILSIGVAASSLTAQDQTAKKAADDEQKPPPELTDVSGRLVLPQDRETSGGVAFFIFQKRLMELSQDNPLEQVKAMTEVAAAVDEGGSFSLDMAPGNYALVYDPSAEPSGENLQAGPESMAVAQRLSPEQMKQRVERIKQNAQRGLPIKDGKLGEAWVVENRIVRPPVTEFGDIELPGDNIVTVKAVTQDGAPVDFPVSLKLRGKNGDIYEPHPPSVSDPGVFVFHDVFPQMYEVFAVGTKPKPGAGDEVTTPTIEKGWFTFEGTPIDRKVTVTPGSAKSGAGGDMTPTPAVSAKREQE